VSKLKKMTLYPRLIPFVGVEWVSPADLRLLGELSARPSPEDDGTLSFILTPRSVQVGNLGFMVMETGADYSGKVRQKILESWRSAGAGEALLSLIWSAQSQGMPKLILIKGGMFPEMREPASIGKIGKNPLSGKKVRSLLRSLKDIHEDTWPIEQLANTVEKYAKLSRQD